jgi:hypothetical protein
MSPRPSAANSSIATTKDSCTAAVGTTSSGMTDDPAAQPACSANLFRHQQAVADGQQH